MTQNSLHVTHHAVSRILKGDKFGLRTKMSVEEFVQMVCSSSRLKFGSLIVVYSEKDDKTYMVWTAERGTVIKTVHDTRRLGSNIADMLARQKAGQPIPFQKHSPVREFDQGNASRVYLGIVKEKKKRRDTMPHVHIKEVYELGHLFLVRKDIDGCLETRELHEFVVDASRMAFQYLGLTRTEARRLQFIIDDEVNRHMGIMPLQLSFQLLGETMPDLPD
ncbi:MAG TPA: hypothetical protein VKP88_05875 [Candidatus Paceibacterota bacterium]|nr:hypothetical protein [Candidatus Paceibacterota bacterium]